MKEPLIKLAEQAVANLARGLRDANSRLEEAVAQRGEAQQRAEHAEQEARQLRAENQQLREWVAELERRVGARLVLEAGSTTVPGAARIA